EVLGPEHLESLVDLKDQIACYLILVAQVHIGFEIADLQIRASEKALWFGMKHESGRASQIVALHEMQLLQKILISLLQDVVRQALTVSCQTAKSSESSGVQISDCQLRQGRAVPRTPVFAQQKPIQRRAPEHLVGAATAVVILPFVADRVGI